MKTFNLLMAMALMCHLSLSAQTKLIEFDVDKQPKKLVISGSNNSEEPLEITLTIKDIKMLKGYDGPITKIVPPKSKVVFKELSYEYDFYKYRLSYTYKKVPTDMDLRIANANKEDYYLKDLSKIDEGIVVFDDDGCGRCTLVTNYLIGNNIDFKIINLANNEANQRFMWKTIKDKGASMNVKAPVIIVNGELSHSHKDLESFLKGLKQ